MSQLVIESTVAGLRRTVDEWRASNQTVALVPTMGNLHRGHLSLARLAFDLADRVVLSIFVNPTQFGAGEDYTAYPRTLDKDTSAARVAGTIDALFVPEVDEIYPFGVEQAVQVKMPSIGRELCGAARPGHFDGVATVVARFLNIVVPDTVVFGLKDYQQLIIIKRMVEDLQIGVRIAAGPIEREPDGLAMSSRNRYLTDRERAIAPELHRTLRLTTDALRDGERDFALLSDSARTRLDEAGFKVDYVEIREARSLGKPNGRDAPEDLIVLGAAWLGKARLIDNLNVSPDSIPV